MHSLFSVSRTAFDWLIRSLCLVSSNVSVILKEAKRQKRQPARRTRIPRELLSCSSIMPLKSKSRKKKWLNWNIKQSQASVFSAQKQLVHCSTPKIKNSAMQQQTPVRYEQSSEHVALNTVLHKERLQGTVLRCKDLPQCRASGKLLLSLHRIFSGLRSIDT